MQWTRMHDGSYHAVNTTMGRQYSYTVRRTFAGAGEKSNYWTVHVNGDFLPNESGLEGCTCRGAKLRAVRHFCRMASEALAATGKPLIEIL